MNGPDDYQTNDGIDADGDAILSLTSTPLPGAPALWRCAHGATITHGSLPYGGVRGKAGIGAALRDLHAHSRFHARDP